MNVIILAGGSGTRLWPISRKGLPKHIVDFFPGGPLFSSAMERAKAVAGKNGHIVVVTSREQERMLRHQANRFKMKGRIHFIVEPQGRNTAPALIAGALFLRDKLAVAGPCAMFPADHLISSRDKFVTQFAFIEKKLVSFPSIVVLGIEPQFPSTSYGYINVRLDNKVNGFYRVKAFTEKPSLQKAKSFIKKGAYYWNSGMLAFDLGLLLDSSERLCPQIVKKCKKFIESDMSDERAYTSIKGISFDYAVLEKLKSIYMLPAKFPWSDLGTWSAVEDVFPKNREGNIVQGNKVYLVDSNNVSVFSGNKTIGVVSVKDLIVVDSNDALLICDKSNTESVRKIVDMLEKDKDDSWCDPDRMERPWGYYVVLDRGEDYKTKRIVVYPGKSLSLQRHKHRSEHWVVLKGTAKVRKENEEIIVKKNQSTYIEKGQLHKLSNPGRTVLEILEIQNGSYLGEDDIERLD